MSNEQKESGKAEDEIKRDIKNILKEMVSVYGPAVVVAMFTSLGAGVVVLVTLHVGNNFRHFLERYKTK